LAAQKAILLVAKSAFVLRKDDAAALEHPRASHILSLFNHYQR
jgi:hypothetical protein